jgi:uncharacterized phage infection (PIP) family protein YhgE
MTTYEWLSLLITVVSLALSIVSIVIAQKSSAKASEANALSKTSNDLFKQANELANKANTTADGANYIALEANNLAKDSNKTSIQAKTLSEGDIELTISQLITETKREIRQISLVIAPLSSKKNRTEDDEELMKLYLNNLHGAIEDNLNAYDEACMKYRDGKVDKVRFKKNYQVQIRQLVEDASHKDYYNPPNTSRFKATLAVYEEWENSEK